MGLASSREEFARAAEGLPATEPDLSDEVVCVEPVGPDYFRDPAAVQRCVVRRGGRLYVSRMD
jgi:hypothetical protein